MKSSVSSTMSAPARLRYPAEKVEISWPTEPPARKACPSISTFPTASASSPLRLVKSSAVPTNFV